MIGLIIFVFYGITGILVARLNYGRLRAKEIAKAGLASYTDEKAAKTLMWGVLLGIIWPYTLILQFISVKPPVTPQELKARDEAREAYVKDLERKLGMGSEEHDERRGN